MEHEQGSDIAVSWKRLINSDFVAQAQKEKFWDDNRVVCLGVFFPLREKKRFWGKFFFYLRNDLQKMEEVITNVEQCIRICCTGKMFYSIFQAFRSNVA